MPEQQDKQPTPPAESEKTVAQKSVPSAEEEKNEDMRTVAEIEKGKQPAQAAPAKEGSDDEKKQKAAERLWHSLRKKKTAPKKRKRKQKIQSSQGKENRQFRLFWMLSTGTMVLFFGVILAVGYTIYGGVTQTLERVQSIFILKEELGIEVIDFERFERVEEAREQKIPTSTPSIERNPFGVVTLATSTEEGASE